MHLPLWKIWLRVTSKWQVDRQTDIQSKSCTFDMLNRLQIGSVLSCLPCLAHLVLLSCSQLFFKIQMVHSGPTLVLYLRRIFNSVDSKYFSVSTFALLLSQHSMPFSCSTYALLLPQYMPFVVACQSTTHPSSLATFPARYFLWKILRI